MAELLLKLQTQWSVVAAVMHDGDGMSGIGGAGDGGMNMALGLKDCSLTAAEQKEQARQMASPRLLEYCAAVSSFLKVAEKLGLTGAAGVGMGSMGSMGMGMGRYGFAGAAAAAAAGAVGMSDGIPTTVMGGGAGYAKRARKARRIACLQLIHKNNQRKHPTDKYRAEDEWGGEHDDEKRWCKSISSAASTGTNMRL
jgi:hypothetical protein